MKLHDLPASRTLAALLFTSFAVVATAGGPDHDHKVTGTLACGGNHFKRADNEEHTTTFNLRNYASVGTITIESVTIYGGSYDPDVPIEPLFHWTKDEGVDFPVERRTTLKPHQSMQFNTRDVLMSYLGSMDRPIQAIFEWSASKKAPDLELSGSATHLARAEGGAGPERSRSQSQCNPLGRDGPWGLLGR